MAYDQDAVDAAIAALRPEIQALETRVAALEAAPAGNNPADEAMLDLSERLSVALNATSDLAERAAIIQRAINALP